MADEINNQGGLPNDDENSSGGAEGSDNSKSGLKDELAKVLGKKFPDDATALKAVKDTFDYVGVAGKAHQAIKAVMEARKVDESQAIEIIKSAAVSGGDIVDTSKFVTKAELEEKTFYSDNPDYKPYTKLVETFKKANPDKSRAEIIQLPDFKESFEKISNHDATEKQKSVLHSNPRMGVVTDKMAKAKQEADAGKHSEATKDAVGAVIDAFGL